MNNFLTLIIFLISLLSCVSTEDQKSLNDSFAGGTQNSSPFPSANGTSVFTSAGGAELIKLAGDQQKLLSFLYTSPQSLRVMALNGFGDPMVDEPIDWTIIQGDGSLDFYSTKTDALGLSSVSVTSGTTPGDLIIKATSRQGQVSFSLEVLNVDYSSHTIEIYSGNNQTSEINRDLSAPLKVLVKDGSGLIANNVPVTFKVSSSLSDSGRLEGNTQIQKITDGQGVATVNFTNGPRSSLTNTVSAEITGFSSVNLAADFSINASDSFRIASVGGTSTLTSQDTQLEASGSDTTLVTLGLRNSLGELDSKAYGQNVSFQASAGQMLGQVQDNGDGTYSQLYQSGTQANSTVLITARVNTVLVESDFASINLVAGAVSYAQSTLSVQSSLINLLASTTFDIQLKDAGGNNLTQSMGSVTCTNNGAGLLSSVTDHGNGTYSVVFSAPASPGLEQVSCALNGNLISGGTETVAYSNDIGAPDATASTLSVSTTLSPAGSVGGGSVLATIHIRDAEGDLCMPGGHNVSLSWSLGTLPRPTDNKDGTYSLWIPTPQDPVKDITLTAKIDGTTLGTQTLSYYGAPDPTSSLLSVSSNSINTGQALIATFQVRDSVLNNLPTAGASVTIESSVGSFTGPVIDHNDGTYSRTLVAQNTSAPCLASESVAVTTTLSGTPSDQTSVTLVNTVDQIPADGTSITCADQAQYQNKNLCILAGRTVSLTTFEGTNETNGAAVCAFKVKNLVIEGILTHDQAPNDSGLPYGQTYYGLELEASELIDIKASGHISADSKGMKGGVWYSASGHVFDGCSPLSCDTSTSNDNIWRSNIYVSGYRSGGSHGGRSGQGHYYETAHAGSVRPYGQAQDPKTPGMGGSRGGANLQGGAGGGILRLKAAKMSIRGQISANGETKSTIDAGAGAGGSIRLEVLSTESDALQNFSAGVIQANGGDAGLSYVGAGAGGRIAIIGEDQSLDYDFVKVNPGNQVQSLSELFMPSGGTIYRSKGCINGAFTLKSDLFIDETNAFGTSNLFCQSTDLTLDHAHVVLA